MAKGHKFGNLDVKKPKQVKSVPIVDPMVEKGARGLGGPAEEKEASEPASGMTY